jgi:hypothetical protein
MRSIKTWKEDSTWEDLGIDEDNVILEYVIMLSRYEGISRSFRTESITE